MRLAAYLDITGISAAAFARSIGCSKATVLNWLAGKVPAERQVNKIYLLTGGRVAPNDLYHNLPRIKPRKDTSENPRGATITYLRGPLMTTNYDALLDDLPLPRKRAR